MVPDAACKRVEYLVGGWSFVGVWVGYGLFPCLPCLSSPYGGVEKKTLLFGLECGWEPDL